MNGCGAADHVPIHCVDAPVLTSTVDALAKLLKTATNKMASTQRQPAGRPTRDDPAADRPKEAARLLTARFCIRPTATSSSAACILQQRDP